MKNDSGITLFTVVSFLGVIMIISFTLVSFVISTQNITQRVYENAKSRTIAEAGIDKAVWCLNNSSACAPSYTGETTNFDGGSFTTVLSSIGQDYEVISSGTFDGIVKKIKVTITTTTTTSGASFFYGVQVGAGGLELKDNSYVEGNIFSNGSIVAGNNSYVTGDVYVAGGTALVADQSQTANDSEFSFGNASATEDIAQSFQPGVTEVINYVSLYVKKVGSAKNATVRIVEDNVGEPATDDIASGTLLANQVTSSFGWVDISFDSNPTLTQGTTYWIVIDVGNPSSSKYYISGLQTTGGYANGIGLYSDNWDNGNWTTAGGDFTFKTWMGGITNSIDGLIIGDQTHTCDDTHYATHHGDAHADQILNSWVECDAFYNTDPTDIAGTTVGRTKWPGSTSPPPSTMPISDGQILSWKATAEAGGTITGNYLLDSSSGSLGPTKITGDLTIDNNATLTIAGTVWVQGNVIIRNNSNVNLDPGYGSNSGILLTDGTVDVRNNVTFSGSGTAGSYLLVLTTYASPTIKAFKLENNTDAAIFYAANGIAEVENNATLKEVTAYKLELEHNTSIIYESGLANANFSDGPGGIWTTDKKTWQEIN